MGVFDTSPLYKYLVTGPDAERLLAGALVRDIKTCRPGQAQYTAWCDDRGPRDARRRGVPALGRRVPPDRGAAGAVVVPGARQRDAGRARGRDRELRDARRPGAAVACRAQRADAGGGDARLLRPRAGQGGRHRGDAEPDRLHRRPRLRADRARGPRGRRARRRAGGGPRPRHPAVRRGGADDAAHRGRAGADRHRVARRPARDERRRHGDAQGARLRLDAARRARRVAAVRGLRGDPPRAAGRHVALGDHRHRRRLGGLGPALPRQRPVPAQVRAPAALRVDDPRRRPQRGRLLHELRLLAGAAAAHRHRPGPAGPRGGRHRPAARAGRQPPQHHGPGHHDRCRSSTRTRKKA